MEIVGYTDRFSVRQNESIRFMVSARVPQYDARLVRLIHGDPRLDGPGFKEQECAAHFSGTYRGHEQLLPKGSYVARPHHARLARLPGMTLHLWFYATTPRKGRQALFV